MFGNVHDPVSIPISLTILMIHKNHVCTEREIKNQIKLN